MGDKEKLRDAVIAAARRVKRIRDEYPLLIAGNGMAGALIEQDCAVRALDAAERPRFEAVRCNFSGSFYLTKGASWALSEDEIRLAARLLNEHYEKQR